MNRDTKFRAWDKSINQMCDVGAIYFLVGGLKVDGTGVLLGNGWATEDNGYTHDCNVVLMQYTGLKDKSGKEIYEGDIIDIKKGQGEHHKNVVVEYEAGAFKMNGVTPLYLVKPLKGEVIGNIYENPELLDAR
jgi:uncharacterized phage protein (TIGR01671 family)